VVGTAVVAIPFWALVGSLDPVGRYSASPRAVRRVPPTTFRPSPVRCQQLQELRQQSMVQCVYRAGRGHHAFPLGDYPLRAPGGLVATGGDVPGAGI
jgi:hypothetical protein